MIIWIKQKKTSSKERATHILTTLYINPSLLDEDTPLQVLYILASKLDKDLAKKIEELLGTSSSEERLRWVKGQLKEVKEKATAKSKTSVATTTDELIWEDLEPNPELESYDDELSEWLEEMKSIDSDELSPMESMVNEYKDSIDTLSEEDKKEINTTLENYYHNAINRELIKEEDGDPLSVSGGMPVL